MASWHAVKRLNPFPLLTPLSANTRRGICLLLHPTIPPKSGYVLSSTIPPSDTESPLTSLPLAITLSFPLLLRGIEKIIVVEAVCMYNTSHQAKLPPGTWAWLT